MNLCQLQIIFSFLLLLFLTFFIFAGDLSARWVGLVKTFDGRETCTAERISASTGSRKGVF